MRKYHKESWHEGSVYRVCFVAKIIKQYRETGNLEPKKSSGRPLKLNDEQRETLDKLVEEKNDWTLEEYQSELEKCTGVWVSRATVDRMTKRSGFTVKKKTLHPTEKESDRVQKERMEFWREIEGVQAENLVVLDEMGSNIALTRLYARSQRGQRARGNKPSQRGKNVSTVGGISLKGVVSSFSILGAFDGITFEAFVVCCLVPNLWKGACVIMDRGSIHKGKKIREAIEAVGAKLVYLPPYSPDFSPIENFWSQVKNYLKKLEARTYPDLAEGIRQALEQVDLQDIYNWFAHCCYCSSPL